jgi:hypothetical protein
MHLYSPEFMTGTSIPIRYTCDGEDISPPLTWADVPAEAQSFVLVMRDRDAPSGPFTHWLLYNLPADVRQLSAGVPPQAKLPNGAYQGQNDFDQIGFRGPCPPAGHHRYFFKLYALDQPLAIAPGANRATVREAMAGHILTAAELMGLYGTSQL